MSKNVLILSSSPRKNGNSDILCDEFAKGAAESGNKVEKIFLKDKKINYCTGCGACTERAGRCSQQDDMTEIREKMIKADVIVFATPIYFYTMSGQMKTFIDRCCFFYTELHDKDFYYIMTAADNDKRAMERALAEFKGFVVCLENIKEKGCIYGTGVWKKAEVLETNAMKQAYEAGKQI